MSRIATSTACLLCAAALWPCAVSAQPPTPVIVGEQFTPMSSVMTVTVRNDHSAAVTALSIEVRATLPDGQVTTSAATVDFMLSEALQALGTPVSDGAIETGMQRVIPVSIPPTSITRDVRVRFAIFEDRTVAGDTAAAATIFANRQAIYEDASYWLATLQDLESTHPTPDGLVQAAMERAGRAPFQRRNGLVGKDVIRLLQTTEVRERNGQPDEPARLAAVIRLLQVQQRVAGLHSTPAKAR